MQEGSAQARETGGREKCETRRRMAPHIVLGDDAAHRVSDDHRRLTETDRRGRHVGDEVGDAEPVEFLPPLALAVAAQRHRNAMPALFREEGEEMLGPDPTAAERAMDEQERGPAEGLPAVRISSAGFVFKALVTVVPLASPTNPVAA